MPAGAGRERWDHTPWAPNCKAAMTPAGMPMTNPKVMAMMPNWKEIGSPWEIMSFTVRVL